MFGFKAKETREQLYCPLPATWWKRNDLMRILWLVLKVFDMINVRVCNGSGVIKEEPPLGLHQMVVWNGGAEGNRVNHGMARPSPHQRRSSASHFICSIPLFKYHTKKQNHPEGWFHFLCVNTYFDTICVHHLKSAYTY